MLFKRKEDPFGQDVRPILREVFTVSPLGDSVRVKKALLVSFFLHGIFIMALLISWPTSSSVVVQDFIPVDLIAIEKVSQRQATSKNAEKPIKDAKIAPPKVVTKKNVEKPTPKISPEEHKAAREQSTPPPQPTQPSKKVAEEKADVPKPIKKVEKLPDNKPLDALLKKEAAQEKEVTTAKKESAPKEEKQKVEKPKAKPVKKEHTKPKNTLNVEALSALLNKTDDQEKAAPPQQNLDTGALNKGVVDQMVGSDAQLSATILDAIRQRISECWNIPAGARDGSSLLIKIEIKLNEDGSLAAYPLLLNRGDHPAFDAAARSAQAAIEACSPYSFLPKDQYALWKDFIINFDPSQMLSPP